MVPDFYIEEAIPADAVTLASLFALSWDSPFTRLQFGSVDPAQLTASVAPRIAERMVKANSKFIVARSQETGEVAAVAQWKVPTEEPASAVEETKEDREHRQQFEDEAYRRNLPDSSNKDLIMAFTLGLRHLREETLQGRRHFLLENLATHPDFRRMGLATRLIEWASLLADEQQVLVYLDTASDNLAAQLYRKLGFEEQGQDTIDDLSKYASMTELKDLKCDTHHTHVAFLRYPQVVARTCT